MIDYLTHYYSMDAAPFQSLSALSDDAAIKIMQTLCDDTLYGERFKDPIQYLKSRKEAEQWVRAAFIAKGGRPKEVFPITMVLGSSKWLFEAAPDREKHTEICIPLNRFTEFDISFTYPDSMVSHWFGRDKPANLYQADLHGIVFTLSEILSLVEQKGMPEEDWALNLPSEIPPYIEAQVWNHELLNEVKKPLKS
ncbi:MAG: hypothetical protein JEZ00_16410 [Anaerolineaceae bacterium]|nr:hypothetical protein [Anaerolineaceae bacterium]